MKRKQIFINSNLKYKTGKESLNVLDEENVSQTVQDDAMSIQELFEQSVIRSGMELEYDQDADVDDIDLEEFQRLDISEQVEWIEELNEKRELFEAEMKKKKKEKETPKEEEELDNSEKSEK